MDLDSTVKPLYSKQEKAVEGYNPIKPGRPSHVIHTYLIAELRLVLGAEVQAGNETASSYAQPSLWTYFDGAGGLSENGSRETAVHSRLASALGSHPCVALSS